MKNVLEFLVPDALVPADFAPDVLRDLHLPHLTALSAHALESSPTVVLSRGLCPWQSWLMRDEARSNIAEAYAQALDAPQTLRQRWMLEPAHFDIERDHLVLTDPERLVLGADEAAMLAGVAADFFRTEGWQLDASDPRRWFITPAPDIEAARLDINGAAIERAVGADVADWLPEGGEAALRAWRRLGNEIQMAWFEHPVNEQRVDRGQPAVNLLWLSGNGAPGRRIERYAHIRSTLSMLPTHLENNLAERDFESYEPLSAAAQSADWSSWRNGVQGLDLRAGELLAELKSGERQSIELVFCGESTLRAWTVRRSDLWKFWRGGAATELFAEVP